MRQNTGGKVNIRATLAFLWRNLLVPALILFLVIIGAAKYFGADLNPLSPPVVTNTANITSKSAVSTTEMRNDLGEHTATLGATENPQLAENDLSIHVFPPNGGVENMASGRTHSKENILTVAWQPSHQDDTGANNWHEYQICGDIVDRAITKATATNGIKCWDLSHGLTGSNNYNPKPTNTIAFDTEIAATNTARATLFIAVHVDGGAPSGILAEYLPGDKQGQLLAQSLVSELCKLTGLPNRGLRAVRLYSLEDNRNKASYKCLLEIGDNARDRKFLENPTNRDKIAEALASAVNNFATD